MVTVAKLSLDGDVIWKATKPGYNSPSVISSAASRALICDGDSVYDLGGVPDNTMWSEWIDEGDHRSFASKSAKLDPPAHRPKVPFHHFVLSTRSDTSERYIWGLPSAWAIGTGSGYTQHWRLDFLRYSLSDRTARAFVRAYGNTGTAAAWMTDTNLPSRKVCLPNSLGGYTIALNGTIPPGNAPSGVPYSQIAAYRQVRLQRVNHENAIVNDSLYNWAPRQDVPLVGISDDEFAVLTRQSRYQVSIRNTDTLAQVRAVDLTLTGSIPSGYPHYGSLSFANESTYRPDAIDSNGTYIASRVIGARQVSLFDNDLNTVFSYLDSNTSHWSVVPQQICAGDEALYQFSRASDGLYAVRFTASGRDWVTKIGGGWSSSPAVFESFERNGVLYVSGRFQESMSYTGRERNLVAVDVATGTKLWERSFADNSTAIYTFNEPPSRVLNRGGEIVVTDDCIYCTWSGYLSIQ